MTHTKPRVIAPLTAATLVAQQVGGTGMRDGLFLSHFAVKAFRISRHVHIRVLNVGPVHIDGYPAAELRCPRT